MLPSPEVVIHEPHYRDSINETQPRPSADNGVARGRASHAAPPTPILISSPAGPMSKADLFAVPSSGPMTESLYFKKPVPLPDDQETLDTPLTNLPPDAPLNIERALGRRLNWTPPRKKAPIISEADKSDTQLDDEEVVVSAKFTKVLEAFKCSDNSTPATTNRSDDDGSVFRKRKLIDAVSTRPERNRLGDDEPAKPRRKAATKKKPRTITGLATAAYKLATQPDPVSPPENQTGGSKRVTATEAAAEGQKGPPKTSRKRTAKVPRRAKKKEPPPKPILLSPSAALRQVANQDFLFGTSSQLAQEHSPRFLRDLETAMKTSNNIDYIAALSTPINSDAIEPPEAKRSLWNAAARDEEGDLFDLGVQELAQNSQSLPPPSAAPADPFGYVREASPGDDSFLSLSDVLRPQQPADTEINTTAANQAASKQTLMSSAPCSQDTGPTLTAAQQRQLPPRPNFELYTDAQLASAVSSYGFKNIRQRGARIALLDKCWQGQNQANSVPGTRHASSLSAQNMRSPSKIRQTKSPVKTPGRPESSLASASQPQEPPPSAQPMSPPKRPRGRPRKTAAATSSLLESVSLCAAALALPPSTPKKSKATSPRAVVEIPDSESDPSELGDAQDLSASPDSTPDETFSPSQEIDLSLSMDEDTEMSTLMPTSDKPVSFDYITKAITSEPRSKDAANPSWHEKMLMYDPIILEDLTAWLNCGPLTKLGYDDEVSSGEVKKWCESKSICCLWKVNLRGKERKRY